MNGQPSSQDQLLDHDYDGIREYDNPMPGWWKAIFLVSFLFSLGYWFWYHAGGSGPSRYDDYAQEMRAHEEIVARFAVAEVKEEELLALVADAGVVAKGKIKFAEACAACHGPAGEGKIGPNLTDDHWIHGAGPVDVFKTVANGVPAKGMPTWSRQLKPDELKGVVAFVCSIRNTNVPGGKAPEGQLVQSSAAAPAARQATP